jgi:hypothetical protein
LIEEVVDAQGENAGTAPVSESGTFDTGAFDAAAFDTPPASNAPQNDPPASPPYETAGFDAMARHEEEGLIAPRPVPPVLSKVALEGRMTLGRGSGGPSPPTNSPHTPPTFPVETSTGGALEIGAPEIGTPKLREKKATRRPRARTAIGKAVLNSRVEIDWAAASFLFLIEERIETLRQERPNSEEAKGAVDAAIAELEDLKRRVEAFLGASTQFAANKAKEKAVVETTNSLAAGIADWWSKRHVQICDKAFDIGLFGIGVTTCLLAGAGGVLAVAIPGAMVGGKPVVEVFKAWARRPHQK